ncbi:hypothetical protein LINPERHAP1_LOCUS3012 [Linum perenne]
MDPGGGWVSFWADFWVRGVCFREVYPRVAAAALYSGALVCDYFSQVDDSSWEIPISGSHRGGAERERQELLAFLGSLPSEVLSEGPAAVIWSLEASGSFSVNSLAKELISNKFVGRRLFPAEVVWNKMVPPRVASFVWLVGHESISTVDNLMRRGGGLSEDVAFSWLRFCQQEADPG